MSRPSWRSVALVASLALNLAFVGLLAGAWMKGPPPPPIPGVGPYVRALPEPYRRDLGRALRADRDGWDQVRDTIRDRRAAFAATLTAVPFEIGAVAEALAADRNLAGGLADHATALMLEQVARMTPEDRAAFATALLDERRDGPWHGRDKPPH